jgi:hypothetical protein
MQYSGNGLADSSSGRDISPLCPLAVRLTVTLVPCKRLTVTLVPCKRLTVPLVPFNRLTVTLVHTWWKRLTVTLVPCDSP